MRKTHDDQASVSKLPKDDLQAEAGEHHEVKAELLIQQIRQHLKQQAELQQENQQLQTKLNEYKQLQLEHKKYKDFYDVAFSTVEILEPTPDIIEQLDAMPNIYKMLIAEYIKDKAYKI